MSASEVEIVQVDPERVLLDLEAVRHCLPPELYNVIVTLLLAYRTVCALLMEKSVTIGRLRQLLFGSKSEKTEVIAKAAQANQPQPNPGESPPPSDTNTEPDPRSDDTASSVRSVPVTEGTASVSSAAPDGSPCGMAL
jgi:hypothetical protein